MDLLMDRQDEESSSTAPYNSLGLVMKRRTQSKGNQVGKTGVGSIEEYLGLFLFLG
jgi:hypothetical protein